MLPPDRMTWFERIARAYLLRLGYRLVSPADMAHYRKVVESIDK